MVFIRDLRRLNDVLAASPLANRFSVCGGLLLGWARDGRVLSEDVRDADFAYFAEDATEFNWAARALVRSGFKADVRYFNNEGDPVEHVFRYHGARFEFFALHRREGRVRYFMYHELDELVCERADHELVRWGAPG